MTGPDLKIGSELRTAPRQMTRERMRWYVDVQPTVAADCGRIVQGEVTIHDDDDFAKAQGLPGIIADGMISTNWILGLLLDHFGRGFARRGKLRTKYILPIYEDERITSIARVTKVEPTPDGGVAYHLEVWCENDKGAKVTVGDAIAYLGKG
jgi:3-hydroxybutyryl-CoA dehydratase